MTSYQLNKAMYESVRPANAEHFKRDKAAYLAGYDLSPAERVALAAPSFSALLAHGGLPNLVYRYFRLHGFRAPDWSKRLADEAAGRAQ